MHLVVGLGALIFKSSIKYSSLYSIPLNYRQQHLKASEFEMQSK